MAEKKYDLLLYARRDSNKKIQPQPWYKERLQTKYNKPGLLKDRVPTLDSSGWTFVKDGLDDFRDGKPPVVDSSIIMKGKKGIKPSLRGSHSIDSSSPKQRIKPNLTKNEVIYSKCVPSHEKRIEKVNELEGNLLAHPLALYPHIEESLAPDAFDELVELLDPNLTVLDDLDEEEELLTPPPHPSTAAGAARIHDTHNDDDDTASSTSSIGFSKILKSNQYKWLHQTQEEITREERNKANRKRLETPQDTKIDIVTKEFCDWVRDLGGDSNNIEESTVNSLFASGYDTKPTLSVPVRVVELTNVPPELRADGQTSPEKQDELGTEKAYTPSWVKVKYGAWYLKPDTWKVLPAGQPLPDPKELEDKQMSEPKKKSKELDKVLTNLHGAKAFRCFVEEKGTRKPEFLETVSAQDEADVLERNTNENLRRRLNRKSTMEPPTPTSTAVPVVGM